MGLTTTLAAAHILRLLLLGAAADAVDLSWHAPDSAWPVSNLTSALSGQGTYGFVFNASTLPPGTPYGTYDWCNMPHVRATEYTHPPLSSFALRSVEVIHRHHKRTPYASNCFPVETQAWSCADAALFSYAGRNATLPAQGFYAYGTSEINPFQPAGFPPFDCVFPQITAGGLADSAAHGRDLAGVYRDLLGLLPARLHARKVRFRVTNNVITSQVAGALVAGMFGAEAGRDVALGVQPAGVDSLEPQYSCPRATALYAAYGVGSQSAAWTAHLRGSAGLASQLDALSGVNPGDSGWHQSWDHYFDNLSARLCHAKPLPCNDTLEGKPCVSQAQADEVFRLGEYEYSFIYRAGGNMSLEASVASYGVWVAELAQHLRDTVEDRSEVVYWHNVAHDGSVSRLLSILQIDRMVWPGMGSELVFELWQKKADKTWYVRVLWGGQPLKSSNPSLGLMDMLPLDTLLAYLDGLVGRGASLVKSKCTS